MAQPFSIEVSTVKRTNSKGVKLCTVIGCEKTAQSNTRINNTSGFCRKHYTKLLIETGQLGSWDCPCGEKVSSELDRCGGCHRWSKDNKGSVNVGGAGEHKKKKEAVDRSNEEDVGIVKEVYIYPTRKFLEYERGVDNSKEKTTAPRTIRLRAHDTSSVRKTNSKGRTLCKVITCTKHDRSGCHGFCLNHFNRLEAPPIADKKESQNIADDEIWTCVCGEIANGGQKRCGRCLKWKGGKRDPYKKSNSVNSSKTAKKFEPVKLHHLPDSIEPSEHWTCKCGTEISSTKFRCSKCHCWRKGARNSTSMMMESMADLKDYFACDDEEEKICIQY